MLKISLFFRKTSIGFFSIEEVFSNLLPFMSGVEVSSHYAPNKRITVWGFVQNLIWARKNQNAINHITGDINYLALFLHKKTILTIHDIGSLQSNSSLATKLKQFIWLKWPASRVGFITTISEFSRAELTKVIPQHAHKIRVIYNPLSQAAIDQQIEKICCQGANILLVGTKPNKNLTRSIEACAGLNVHLHILGALNEDQKKVLEQTKSAYTNYTGLSRQEVYDFYRTGDMLCFPSTYEGFGLPIIEAQTFNVPVLTSNLGAMKEVAGDSAYLVDPFNKNEIRSGVIKLSKDTRLKNQLIEKGKQNINRFHPEKIAKQYVELYHALAQDKSV